MLSVASYIGLMIIMHASHCIIITRPTPFFSFKQTTLNLILVCQFLSMAITLHSKNIKQVRGRPSFGSLVQRWPRFLSVVVADFYEDKEVGLVSPC